MLLIGATWTCIETCFLLCLASLQFRRKVGPLWNRFAYLEGWYSFGKLFPALARLGKKNETTEGCSSGFGSKLTQGRNTWRGIKPYLLILLYEDRVLNFNTPHPHSFKTLQHYRAAREKKAPWDPSPVGSGHPPSLHDRSHSYSVHLCEEGACAQRMSDLWPWNSQLQVAGES